MGNKKMTRAEKETIITFNEAEDVAIVYTHNGKIKRDIEKAIENSDDEKARKVAEGKHGDAEYAIPKKWVKIRAGRSMTEEQRQAAVERGRKLAEARLSKNV